MMGLEEALRFIQIGFYLGVGALIPLATAFSANITWGSPLPAQAPEAPDINVHTHCEYCCPKLEPRWTPGSW